MFPDAYYIHIIRDGRAVTSSLLNVGWLPDTKFWWKEQSFRFDSKSNNVELCAMHWKKDTEELLANSQILQPNYIEIRYEDLVESTREIVKKVSGFCNLTWSSKYEDLIPEKLPNMNSKWQATLGKEAQEIMKKNLSGILADLGYI